MRKMIAQDLSMRAAVAASVAQIAGDKKLTAACYCVSTACITLLHGDIEQLAELITVWAERTGFLEELAGMAQQTDPLLAQQVREILRQRQGQDVEEDIRRMLEELEL